MTAATLMVTKESHHIALLSSSNQVFATSFQVQGRGVEDETRALHKADLLVLV